MESDICIICKTLLGSDDVVILSPKGAAGLNKACKARNGDLVFVTGQGVHSSCRQEYCKPQEIAKSLTHSSPSNSDTARSRRSLHTFNFKEDCLFCGKNAILISSKKRSASLDTSKSSTIELKKSLLTICDTRGVGDKWAEAVRSRLETANDLPAEEAIYHKACNSNFRTGKGIPSVHDTGEPKVKISKVGRPTTDDRHRAFLNITKYLSDNDDEQITVSDLVSKMNEYLHDSENSAYCNQYLQQKLLEYFGDQIVVTEINGRANVVTFRKTANNILHEFHNNQVKDPTSEKKNILDAAAALLKADIKFIETSSTYPDFSDMDEESMIRFLPESLRTFLEALCNKSASFKVASVGQAIIQAVRSRVLQVPLQIGLGIQLHHHFSSRFLIDTLHKHGFTSSYEHVSQFLKDAAAVQGTDIPQFDAQFLQYAADNVDHNSVTLDGKGTFHGMGLICTVTPGTKSANVIARAKTSMSDVTKANCIPIIYHKGNALSSDLKYTTSMKFDCQDPTRMLDVLWWTTLVFKARRPLWNGMMQYVHKGTHPGKSSIVFLPMINMNPTDMTCILSTLSFISHHATRYGVTPIVTFDQPLWWKSMVIIESEPVGSNLKEIVLRLGGFHNEMSFLGSIGTLMAGSDLRELFDLVYAHNAVDHMLSGKAVARAVRAHLLVAGVLHSLLVCQTFSIQYPVFDGTPLNTSELESENTVPLLTSRTGHCDIDHAKTLYNDLMDGSKTVDEVCNDRILHNICASLSTLHNELKSDRTSALWLQYLDMVDILCRFLKAERTGNWGLHLSSLCDMLPYLAAAGHNHYTKSVYLYLQKMCTLETDHPEVYKHFLAGLHVARRTDRYWGGLSIDLLIEQVLMRGLKSTGGLTRGSGMSEQQRHLWLQSMPACIVVNNIMQEMSGVVYETSEQHKDLTKARLDRDMTDTNTLATALQDRNPFRQGAELTNIMTGVCANDQVNVDKAKDIGRNILQSMEGESVSVLVFKRKVQAITMANKSVVRIDGDVVQVDPELMFQRLVVAARGSNNMQDVFKYELCNKPASLFDVNGFLRTGNKSALAEALWLELAVVDPPLDPPSMTRDIQYVLDGGALLYRIVWPHTATYRDVIMMYVRYVVTKYGTPVVVFDGYEAAYSTKNLTQEKRSGGKASPIVSFTEDMVLTIKKDLFLTNKVNKQKFIYMLGEHLSMAGCKVCHSPGDADLNIVKQTIDCGSRSPTTLIGDDTDLLILLCHHTPPGLHKIVFRPEPKQNTKKTRVWCIQDTIHALGTSVCNDLLFLHAILGCDTTSFPYGIGKSTSLKKYKIHQIFREQAAVFARPSATPADVIAAGEKALVCLYNGRTDMSLDHLRYRKFCDKVVTKKSHVTAQNLPPTSAACKYHSLRVYYQVQQWQGVKDLQSPSGWGWDCTEGTITPIKTDLSPAPDELMRVIRCNCQGDCSGARCTCRKNNFECTNVCGQCRGTSCSNSSPIVNDDDIPLGEG